MVITSHVKFNPCNFQILLSGNVHLAISVITIFAEFAISDYMKVMKQRENSSVLSVNKIRDAPIRQWPIIGVYRPMPINT